MRSLDPSALPVDVRTFLTERHLATLTTLRPDGSPHVVAIGFTWDDAASLARVITRAGSRKARNLAVGPGTRAAVCQVDGARWMTLEGPAEVTADADRVAEAVHRYALRYRPPGERSDRVAIEISVDRGSGGRDGQRLLGHPPGPQARHQGAHHRGRARCARRVRPDAGRDVA
ncbi:MAG: TIGR03618 family F420-dependent PPOX class oxidoreductase [Acidimicrobiales bacterium]